MLVVDIKCILVVVSTQNFRQREFMRLCRGGKNDQVMFLIVGEALSIWRKRLAFVEADAVVAHLRVCKTERADGARDRDRHCCF